VHVAGSQFLGRIVRRSEADFAVELDHGIGAHTAMVRQVYSGGFTSAIGQISSVFVARKVLARLFS
jgi:hypothetical protein